MLWLIVHLKFLITYYRLLFFPEDQNGKHSWTGPLNPDHRRVTSYPEVAARFMYYRKGLRTYKLYTGNYSRLGAHA